VDSPSSEDLPLRFIVPDDVLEQAHEWQTMHGRILTLPMPAISESWHEAHKLDPELFNITTLQENP
jgi:hypothetical protein